MKTENSKTSGTVILFSKNGLGNIIFAIEAASRYAHKYGKKLFVDLNETGHYGEKPLQFADLFSLKGIEYTENWDFKQFKNPFPSQEALFDRSTIDNELYETTLPSSRLGQLKVWYKYDRWRYHWRYKNGGYAVRNAEYLGTLGKNHDAILFLSTYIRNEAERFLHFGFSKKFLQFSDQYFSQNNLNQNPDFAIHIRYTDNLHHAGGRIRGGLEKAVRHTREFLKTHQKTSLAQPIVHLASDNAMVIGLFQDEFGEDCQLQFLPISRNEKALHINHGQAKNTLENTFELGLLDIILLSNSKCLAFMGNSSFSRVARNMHPLHCKSFDWNS